MPIDLMHLKKIGLSPLSREEDVIVNGHIRLKTGFLYPDGSNIDVFLKNEDSQLLEDLTLTDFGNTISWLDHAGIDVFKSAAKRSLIEQMVENTAVSFKDGQLIKHCSLASLPDALLDLGQTCVRVSDLLLMQKNKNVVDFKGAVEEMIISSGRQYHPDVEIIGVHGRLVTADFQVSGRTKTTALFTIYGSKQTIDKKADDVFARVYDLQGWDGQKIATYDDTASDLISINDVNRMSELCVVVPFKAGNDHLKTLIAV